MEEKTRVNQPAQTEAPDWLANVWHIKTSKKIKVFIWRSLHDAIPVGEQFSVRNIHVSTRCVRCNEEEYITHMLFHCPYAKQVWDLAPAATMINPETFADFREGWERIRKINSLPSVGIEAGSFAAWILWSIWLSRNHLVFQKRSFSPTETMQKAPTYAREWKLAQIPPIQKPPKQLRSIDPKRR